jgi:hypothetical protein
VTLVELCRLTRDDVEASLATVGDSSSLLHALEEAGAAALLVRPVTLLMILGLLRNGQRPDPLTRRSLYERGIRQLIAERNNERHGTQDSPTIDERVAAARRLAAVSVFCDQSLLVRSSVETGASRALCVAELADNSAEPSDVTGRQTPQLTARHFDACLESGLFREQEGAVTWAHASFADFLAAEYVRLREVPYAQLRSMLGLGRTAIPLHLEGVSGWIAEFLPALRAELLQTSPHILLQAMTVELADEERAQAVDFFLQEIAEGRAKQPSFEVLRRAQRLRHPQLAAQLRRWLALEEDLDVTLGALHLALAIGGQELADLIDELAELALDPAQPSRARHVAALCVVEHGKPNDKARLATFLEPPPPAGAPWIDEDPNDELRGCALRALWPEQLTPEQLFAALTPPKRQNYSGAYKSFLYDLTWELPVDVLPAALAWARTQQPVRDHQWPTELVASIVKLALEQPDVAPWLDALLEMLAACYGAFRSLNNWLGVDQSLPLTARRQLVTRLVERLGSSPNVSGELLWQNTAEKQLLVNATELDNGLLEIQEDLPWLLEKANEAVVATSWWFHVLRAALVHVRNGDGLPEGVFARLHQICCEHPVLNSVLREPASVFFEFFEIEFTQELLRKLARDAAIVATRCQQAALVAASENERRQHIEQFAEGIVESPAQARDALPLSLGPGDPWNALGAPLQAQLAERAMRWLQCIAGAECVSATTLQPDDIAWCVAVIDAAGKTATVPAETWRGILMIFDSPLEWRESWHRDTPAVDASILKHGAEILAGWVKTQSFQDSGWDGLLELFPSRPPWPPQILHALSEVLPNSPAARAVQVLHAVPNAHFSSFSEVVTALLAADDPAIRIEVQKRIFVSDDEQAKAALVKELLGSPATSEGRAFAEAILHYTKKRNTQFPQELVRQGQIRPMLSPTLAAIVYPWLVREYRQQDAEHESAAVSTPGPEDDRRRFQGYARACLSRGDVAEVVAALERVVQEIPEDADLNARLHAARRQLASDQWHLSPAQLLSLMRHRELRLVRNEAELADVVIESIQRFDAHLQGETAEAESLWNDSYKCAGKEIPQTRKREEALSNALARHLRRDLQDHSVIIHREVEVRPGKNSHMGRRTDVHVNAISKDSEGSPGQKLQLIIEVKPCWAKEWDDVQGQLVDRYMAHVPCAGIFLVGRYACGCGVCKKFSVAQMADELEKKARAIRTHQLRTIVVNCSWTPSGP